jgi:hypothetical protein
MKFGVSVTRRLLAACSIAAACALVCGCSSTPFPVVLSDPPPPAETTLNTDQVKQAMDELVSDRKHICSEAIAEGATNITPADCASGNAGGASPNAGAAAKP